ncbi:MAG: hypothetical protein HUJ61_02205 [Bacilli bacterium]|nr:hypothetical protein [Bacilli bacterium]
MAIDLFGVIADSIAVAGDAIKEGVNKSKHAVRNAARKINQKANEKGVSGKYDKNSKYHEWYYSLSNEDADLIDQYISAKRTLEENEERKHQVESNYNRNIEKAEKELEERKDNYRLNAPLKVEHKVKNRQSSTLFWSILGIIVGNVIAILGLIWKFYGPQETNGEKILPYVIVVLGVGVFIGNIVVLFIAPIKRENMRKKLIKEYEDELRQVDARYEQDYFSKIDVFKKKYGDDMHKCDEKIRASKETIDRIPLGLKAKYEELVIDK